MKKIYLIITLVFFILILAGNTIYLLYFVKQVETRKMYLEALEKRTIFEEDILHFGAMYPGSIGDRVNNVYMTNNFDYPMVVSVKITGNISAYVAVSDNNFKLVPGEKKVLSYKADIPADIKNGIYSGETRVVFTRSLN